MRAIAAPLLNHCLNVLIFCYVACLAPTQVACVDFCTESPIKHNMTQRYYTFATVLETATPAALQAARLTLGFLNNSLQEAFDPPIYIRPMPLEANTALAQVVILAILRFPNPCSPCADASRAGDLS
jgi:hypothetical protein